MNNTAAVRAISNEKLVRKLFSIPGVTFIGTGKKTVGGVQTDEDAVIVGVVTKVSEQDMDRAFIIPKEIGGFRSKVRTDVVETGVITLKSFPDAASPESPKSASRMPADPHGMTRSGSGTHDRCSAAGASPCEAFMGSCNRTVEHNPAPGGISIGHHDITAGTLGMMVKKGGIRHILSNNHVLANCNQGDIGDAIYQPGPYDGGTDLHMRAVLSEFVVINESGPSVSQCPVASFVCRLLNLTAKLLRRSTFLVPVKADSGDNLVDCALARPVEDGTFSDCVAEVGMPGLIIVEPVVGMAVKKSGRTTGLTKGKITAVNVTAQVVMGDWVAVFADQVAMTHMVDGGDSGSILFEDTPDNNVVGLCFAGSDTISFANRFTNVEVALDLEGYRHM